MDAPPPLAALDARDAGHLRLLSIFHYVMAGLAIVALPIPIAYLVLGWRMTHGQPALWGLDLAQGADPHLMGGMFMAFACLMMVINVAMSIALAMAGRSLAQRRRPTLCTVVAAVSCLSVPFGTALGLCTLIVLARPSVRAVFEPMRA